jgi:hypothetical protein
MDALIFQLICFIFGFAANSAKSKNLRRCFDFLVETSRDGNREASGDSDPLSAFLIAEIVNLHLRLNLTVINM